MLKNFFALTGERSSIATRMAGYKKRWFVLRADGMLLYYKDQPVEGQDSECALPVDFRNTREVTDPDELEQLRLFSEGKVEKVRRANFFLRRKKSFSVLKNCFALTGQGFKADESLHL